MAIAASNLERAALRPVCRWLVLLSQQQGRLEPGHSWTWLGLAAGWGSWTFCKLGRMWAQGRLEAGLTFDFHFLGTVHPTRWFAAVLLSCGERRSAASRSTQAPWTRTSRRPSREPGLSTLCSSAASCWEFNFFLDLTLWHFQGFAVLSLGSVTLCACAAEAECR